MTRPGTKRFLIPICLSALLWAFSFGLGAPLASLWLQDAQYGDTLIGLNTATYYLGIALAAPLVPALMRRSGRGTLVAGMVASGISVAWFPWGGSLGGWFALRALNGAAGAMSLVPLETLVNRTASPQERSRNFGYYALCIAVGMALGTGLGMQMYPFLPRWSFLYGGTSAVLAAVVVYVWMSWPRFEEARQTTRASLALGGNLLSYGSAWSQGYLEGGMVGLLPVYLLAIGLAESDSGWLMGGIMIGVILAQVPVAWLADRFGRTRVLLGCYGVSAVALIALMCRLPIPGMAMCLFLAGACSGAFYPLGLAILGERVAPSSLPRASACYLSINCVGSVMGPALTGGIMDVFGKHALFAAGEGAVLAVLCACLVRRLLFASGKPNLASPPVEQRPAA
jgi:MFS family permease